MNDPGERDLQIPCLSGILDLQDVCQRENVKFSSETNRYLVTLMLKKLGPLMAAKLLNKLMFTGDVLWDQNANFEVDDVLDKAVDDNVTYYYIKWKGWSHEFNTWEPEDNLECHELITDYHKRSNRKTSKRLPPENEVMSKRRKVEELVDKLFKSPVHEKITPMQIMSMSTVRHGSTNKIIKGLMTFKDRKPRRIRPNSYNNTKSKCYKQTKQLVQVALQEWQDKLNAVCADPAPISVENTVDLEGPPENFVYINDYKAMDGIEIPQDPLVGCECTDCYSERKSCCPANCGTEFAFYRGKRLRVSRGVPIYECNKRCKCGPECPNRVVQQGRRFKVSVFRTSNGRGWGVKTLQNIKRGSFVVEYVGEVITNEEAERRGKRYDAEGRTYLFDLDYNDGDCPFTVDAGYYGNVSHFVNHSCDPNLEVFGVWINTLDPRLPRIALFAKRDIARGEELTFDYMMTVDSHQSAFKDPSSAEVPSPRAASKDGETESTAANKDSAGAAAAADGVEDKQEKPAASKEDSNVSKSDRDENGEDEKQYRIVCQCGADNCRKYLF